MSGSDDYIIIFIKRKKHGQFEDIDPRILELMKYRVREILEGNKLVLRHLQKELGILQSVLKNQTRHETESDGQSIE